MRLADLLEGGDLVIMRTIKDALYGAMLALQFLTQLPVRFACPWNERTAKWALRMFPLAGFAVGGAVATVDWLSGGRTDWLGALLLLTVWVAVTGALHLEGWMDVTDAAMSQAQGERRWAIMKDPHVGSFAIVSVVLLLLWKLMLVHEVLLRLESGTWLFFLMIPAMARTGALAYMRWLPSARSEGLGAEWKRHLGSIDVLIAVFILIPLWLADARFGWLGLALLGWTLLYGSWCKLRFGGMNGDLTGAYIEGAELSLLLACWWMT